MSESNLKEVQPVDKHVASPKEVHILEAAELGLERSALEQVIYKNEKRIEVINGRMVELTNIMMTINQMDSMK